MAALEREVFGADAWSATATRAELTADGRTAVVAEAEDAGVVGYAVLNRAGDLLDLHRIAVRPSYRRRGLARALLTAALDEAPPGADRILLEVAADNEAARAFYAAAGFTPVGRRPRYYRDGRDALVLRRPLGRGCGGRR